jgi:SAM-dependent methyltransferase
MMLVPERTALAARRCGYRSARRYAKRSGFLFDGVDLAGKSVLEVGCGRGAFALWAGLQGASRVLGIDPGAAGSAGEALGDFTATVNELGLGGVVSARKAFLHELARGDGPFDVAVLFNVINHLDEEATRKLPARAAVDAFSPTLEHLRALMAPGGTVIVGDSGRGNLWPRIGLPNPISPTVEWDKHADPDAWRLVFAAAGLRELDRRWSPAYPLGRLSSNRAFQYATTSHFVMRFCAPTDSKSRE